MVATIGQFEMAHLALSLCLVSGQFKVFPQKNVLVCI